MARRGIYGTWRDLTGLEGNGGRTQASKHGIEWPLGAARPVAPAAVSCLLSPAAPAAAFGLAALLTGLGLGGWVWRASVRRCYVGPDCIELLVVQDQGIVVHFPISFRHSPPLAAHDRVQIGSRTRGIHGNLHKSTMSKRQKWQSKFTVAGLSIAWTSHPRQLFPGIKRPATRPASPSTPTKRHIFAQSRYNTRQLTSSPPPPSSAPSSAPSPSPSSCPAARAHTPH